MGFSKMGERARATEVALRLVTIHPNPGPGGQRASEQEKARRMARKMQRRKDKREERQRQERQEEVKTELVVVAWNVQRMSVSTRGRRKMKAVVEVARRSGVGE